MSDERKSQSETPDGGPPINKEIPLLNRSFGALVSLLGLGQKKAGEHLGIEAGTVSEYVSGKREMLPANYDRKCGGFGRKAATAGDRIRAIGEWLESAEAPPIPCPNPTSDGLSAEISGEAARLAASLPARVRAAVAEEAKRKAHSRLRCIKKLKVSYWRLIADAAEEVRCWAFVKVVGEESAREASVDAGRAQELASFALWIAERVPGAEGWVCQVFAWAFLANTRRVGNDFKGAEEALACSQRLQADPPEERPELPEPWRLLDLEASLRIDLRQLPEALRLLDQAAKSAPRSGPVRAHLLCIRSIALDRIGDLERSIAVLREALAEIDEGTEPHLFCMLKFNLADCLTATGQSAEAAEMLPALRRLQAQIGDGLNQIRLRWLEGKIDAGLGRLDPAIETLSSVRSDFSNEGLRYDEAQAGVDLAGLYLRKGRTADARRLLLKMESVFRDEGVHAEAQKALALFLRAVEMETATVELAGRVAGYLRRAQYDPDLVFEEAA
jgi:tetratricopeptide (TPR) repeat protein